VRTVEELLGEFPQHIEALTLIPSDGGVFDVTVDDDLVFSKEVAGRHAGDGEVVDLVRARL